MRLKKDLKLDIAYLELKKGLVVETIEPYPGILFDLDKKGEVLGIEILSLEKLAPLLAKNKTKKVA